MAQTPLCDQGCGREYFLEIGTNGDPIHNFYCLEHAAAWWLELLNAMEQAQLVAEGAEPGTEAEGKPIIMGRSRKRGARSRSVAVDTEHGAVVEHPPAEDGSTEASGE